MYRSIGEATPNIPASAEFETIPKTVGEIVKTKREPIETKKEKMEKEKMGFRNAQSIFSLKFKRMGVFFLTKTMWRITLTVPQIACDPTTPYIPNPSSKAPAERAVVKSFSPMVTALRKANSSWDSRTPLKMVDGQVTRLKRATLRKTAFKLATS